MNFDQTLENILNQIKEVENKTLSLQNNGEIKKIEMDLLLQRVRELYDQLLSLSQDSRADQTISTSRKQTETESKQPEYEPEQQATAEEKQPTSNAGAQTANNSADSIPEEKSTKEEPEEEPHTPVQEADIQTEKTRNVSDKQESPEIVADRFQNTKTFMHDNLVKKQAKSDVSSKMQSKPIHDLNKAIGVNDKFLFVRELFEGNRDRYHEALQIINEIPTYEEAETYISESFDWNWEKPEVKKFMDLVKRKFI